MEQAKTMKTPMSSSIKLDKDKKGKSIDSTMYRGMIGSLLYLTTSRPDIMHSAPMELSGTLEGSLQIKNILEHPTPFYNFSHSSHQWLSVDGSKNLQNSSSSSCFVSIFYGSQTRACNLQDIEQIHLGYLMVMHMIACCESTTRVLPYGRFLTRVFKDVGIDLSREMDFEVLSTYNTYDDQSMERMKFEKAPDGPKLDIPPLQIKTLSQTKGVQFEITFFEPMMTKPTFTEGLSTQSSYTEFSFSGPAFTEPTRTKIPPPQAPPAPDHAPWMDLSAQISSLGTCMEELVVVSDTCFYFMEDRMDQY
ncbi:hypothetical protein AAG906_020435 [Vitis piasezkii]